MILRPLKHILQKSLEKSKDQESSYGQYMRTLYKILITLFYNDKQYIYEFDNFMQCRAIARKKTVVILRNYLNIQ
jgi:hypothetical protein